MSAQIPKAISLGIPHGTYLGISQKKIAIPQIISTGNPQYISLGIPQAISPEIPQENIQTVLQKNVFRN